MKLEEAIEVLPEFFELCAWPRTQGQIDALKLGIEALRWRKLMEDDYGSWCGPLLPGETKD